MITDGMLREAAAEAEDALLSQLPDGGSHSFSPDFEKKMKRLHTRSRHPVLHPVLRYAAAILLVCVTVFGMLLIAVPEVSASIPDWYRSDCRNWTASGLIPVEDRVEYCLTYIPEGYDVWDVMDILQGKTYLYADSEGRFLSFSYWYDGTAACIVKGYTRKFVPLGDVTAELFLTPWEDDSSCILWKDKDGGVAFSVSAFGDEELLIQLALSVEEKK